MIISKQKPKCWDKIAAAFPITWESGIIVTYAGMIHTCTGRVADDILVHEEVHIKQQQGIDPDEWVERFITDPKFRFEVELEAFKAQANYLRHIHRYDHKTLHGKIEHIRRHLSSPMYGNIVSYEEAKKLI